MPGDEKALTPHLLCHVLDVLPQRGVLCDLYSKAILLLWPELICWIYPSLVQDAASAVALGSVCCAWSRQGRRHNCGPIYSIVEKLANCLG